LDKPCTGTDSIVQRTEGTNEMPKLLTAAVLASGAALATAAGATAAPAQPTTTADKNIVETAVAAGDFTTLVGLVQRAGLADALSGDDKLTVFAPTDEAFSKVPAATLKKLGRKPKLLRRVLKYHVVAGDVKAASIVERRSVRTLAGAKIKIRVRDGNVRLNRSANVVKTDIAASNGTIHVIDRVLLPPRRG
jgi:uncharacterized surface protein with fasciclin (FAS1) repeats